MTSHGGQFKRTVFCAHFFENWSKKKNKRTFSHDVGPLKDNNPTCLFNSVGDKTRLLLHSLLEGESIQIMVGEKQTQHTKKIKYDNISLHSETGGGKSFFFVDFLDL